MNLSNPLNPSLIIDLEATLDGLYARYVLAVDPDQGDEVLAVIDRHVAGWHFEQAVEEVYTSSSWQ